MCERVANNNNNNNSDGGRSRRRSVTRTLWWLLLAALPTRSKQQLVDMTRYSREEFWERPANCIGSVGVRSLVVGRQSVQQRLCTPHRSSHVFECQFQPNAHMNRPTNQVERLRHCRQDAMGTSRARWAVLRGVCWCSGSPLQPGLQVSGGKRDKVHPMGRVGQRNVRGECLNEYAGALVVRRVYVRG